MNFMDEIERIQNTLKYRKVKKRDRTIRIGEAVDQFMGEQVSPLGNS